MKFIHCADIHLESAMTRNLPPEKARERRVELLRTFEKMVEYGKEQGVTGILIAGDLFDTRQVTKSTRAAVWNCICENPQIDFLYLKGNHDETSFYEGMGVIPENLKTFGKRWQSYPYGNVTVTGVELDPENSQKVYGELALEPDQVNIVMMHGQESDYQSRDGAELIHLGSLRERYIDYLALGHVHSYRYGKLDARGAWCYCGCLEGRGYDESGEKGFVLLSVQGKNVEAQFIPFRGRPVFRVESDVTGCQDNRSVSQAIAQAVEGISPEAMVKVVLKGKVPLNAQFSLDYLEKRYIEDFYDFKLKDETVLRADPEEYKNDASLKGEFIRLVLEQEMDGQRRRALIETGLQALAGEELEQ